MLNEVSGPQGLVWPCGTSLWWVGSGLLTLWAADGTRVVVGCVRCRPSLPPGVCAGGVQGVGAAEALGAMVEQLSWGESAYYTC